MQTVRTDIIMTCTLRMDFKHGILKTALEERERRKTQNLQLPFSMVRRHTRAVAGGMAPLILNLGDRGE